MGVLEIAVWKKGITTSNCIEKREFERGGGEEEEVKWRLDKKIDLLSFFRIQ